MDVLEFVIALLGGGLVAGIAEIIRARSSAKQADVDKVFNLINELQEDNGRLRETLRVQDEHIKKVENYYREKCNEYEQIIQNLRREIDELSEIIHANGIDPAKKTWKGRYL